MGTDIRRHAAPLGGETPRRQAINDLSLTVNDIVPVANTTERAQLVAALTASTVTPSPAPSVDRPLYVHRRDAQAGWELECTTDGTTWTKVRGAVVQGRDSGVIQSWSMAATTSGAGGLTVNYPVPFPTAVTSVVPTIGDSAPSNVGFCRVEAFTTGNVTNFVVRVYSLTGTPILNTAVRLNVIAVGY